MGMQDSLREAHEDAMRKAISAFNASAVGVGSARSKFEKLLHSSLRKAFEVSLLLVYYLSAAFTQHTFHM
jgi:hypothetical protein